MRLAYSWTMDLEDGEAIRLDPYNDAAVLDFRQTFLTNFV